MKLGRILLVLCAASALAKAGALKDRALELLNSPTNEIVFCTRPLAECPDNAPANYFDLGEKYWRTHWWTPENPLYKAAAANQN